MERLSLALLAVAAFATFFPSTDCGGLSLADCNRLAAINAAIID